MSNTGTTAALSEINGTIWDRYRHLITLDGVRYVLTAVHGRDTSTARHYDSAPNGAVRVSLLNTATRETSKHMLPGETVFDLIEDRGQSYL